jgi:UrcA family protein
LEIAMKNIAMKNPMRLLTVATLAAGHFSSAAAGGHISLQAQAVRFVDLDTGNSHDVAVLYRRIAEAAHDVCRERGSSQLMDLSAAYAHCVHRAIANAVADIDIPEVTAYAVSRGVAAACTDRSGPLVPAE